MHRRAVPRADPRGPRSAAAASPREAVASSPRARALLQLVRRGGRAGGVDTPSSAVYESHTSANSILSEAAFPSGASANVTRRSSPPPRRSSPARPRRRGRRDVRCCCIAFRRSSRWVETPASALTGQEPVASVKDLGDGRLCRGGGSVCRHPLRAWGRWTIPGRVRHELLMIVIATARSSGAGTSAESRRRAHGRRQEVLARGRPTGGACRG